MLYRLEALLVLQPTDLWCNVLEVLALELVPYKLGQLLVVDQ